MADPAFWPQTSVYARKTLGDIRAFVARQIGKTHTNIQPNDSSVLNEMINDEAEEFRLEFPGLRGMGERETTLTWVASDVRQELPENFAEFLPGGKAVLLSTTGDDDSPLEIIDRAAVEHGFKDGTQSPYDDRTDPVAYVFGTSTNGRRMFYVYPPPSTAVQIRITYTAHLEKLVNNADELEGPKSIHRGIEWGVCEAWFTGKVDTKAQMFKEKKKRILALLKSPTNEERGRLPRVRSFEEVGGTTAFEYAEQNRE
jgi:hypothetical protein